MVDSTYFSSLSFSCACLPYLAHGHVLFSLISLLIFSHALLPYSRPHSPSSSCACLPFLSLLLLILAPTMRIPFLSLPHMPSSPSCTCIHLSYSHHTLLFSAFSSSLCTLLSLTYSLLLSLMSMYALNISCTFPILTSSSIFFLTCLPFLAHAHLLFSCALSSLGRPHSSI
jgi:hypothetical protein